ncbi:TatD like proteins [Peptoniphilus sp. ING2-D1G]|nr:TatD like proteins [Peptoniphilus sp. ING2-D1G]
MIDSHVHLDDPAFDYDREALIKKLPEQGISRVYNIGADIESSVASVKLADEYDHVKAVIGIHPHSAKTYNDEIEEKLIELAKNENVKAIGEIGLDYYYDNSPRDIQVEVFKKQIELAHKLGLPIVIHSRSASQETFDIIKSSLKEYPDLKFLIHCFSQSVEMMKEYVKMGCYIALGGVVTFKNSKEPKKVAEEVPLDKLLLETDCPYLAPVPMRVKRNEPYYIKYVAEEIAKIRNISVDELVEVTDANTRRFYDD